MSAAPAQRAEGEASPRTVDVSLIIPAYDEARRLPATLATVLAFLDSQPYSWELIVADDGSEDDTPAIAARAAARPGVRHLRLPHRGKAATVRAGVAAAAGRSIIFTDADLSTPVSYVAEAHCLLERGWDVVIGTREAPEARRVGEPLHRHVMGRLFNYACSSSPCHGVRDTQCGFKPSAPRSPTTSSAAPTLRGRPLVRGHWSPVRCQDPLSGAPSFSSASSSCPSPEKTTSPAARSGPASRQPADAVRRADHAPRRLARLLSRARRGQRPPAHAPTRPPLIPIAY